MLRVSNTMMTENTIRYIQDNLQRTTRLQEEISTSKTIDHPSDNPSEISHVMAVNATIARNAQYTRNIDDGLSYLNQSDAALNTVGATLQDAKTLAVQGVNGTLSSDDRKAIAEQIDKQIEALVDLGNSSLGGKYIFAGKKNDQPPFCRINDEVYYRGDTNRVTREVIFGSSYEVDAAGVTVPPDTAGVFGTLDTSTMIDDPMNPGPPQKQMTKVTGGPLGVLKNLRDRLQNNDTTGINQSLGELDTSFDNEQVQRVAVGARTRHLEAVQEQLAEQEINLKEVLVNVQGADITKLTVEVAQNDLLYQASLSTSAKLLQTSLLNYLH